MSKAKTADCLRTTLIAGAGKPAKRSTPAYLDTAAESAGVERRAILKGLRRMRDEMLEGRDDEGSMGVLRAIQWIQARTIRTAKKAGGLGRR